MNVMYLREEYGTLAFPERSIYDPQPKVSTAFTFYWLFRAPRVFLQQRGHSEMGILQPILTAGTREVHNWLLF